MGELRRMQNEIEDKKHIPVIISGSVLLGQHKYFKSWQNIELTPFYSLTATCDLINEYL